MTTGTGRQLAMVAALALTCCWSTVSAQNIDFASVELRTVKVADGLFVLMGGPAQGNIAVSAGTDGVFLVDSMYAPMHQKIIDAIAKISPQPVRYVVNTHLHGDHTAGNAAMAKLGAVIISHQNMRTRMAAPQNNPPPAAALPVLTYADSITLHFNGEEIQIFHPAPAHTDGDSIVYFKRANVMHVGDVPASLRYPNIGVNDGGSVDGMMAAGRLVMKVANPQTRIIPGHLGPIDRIQRDRAAADDVCRRARAGVDRDPRRTDARAGRGREADQGLRRGPSGRRDHARSIRRAGLHRSVEVSQVA